VAVFRSITKNTTLHNAGAATADENGLGETMPSRFDVAMLWGKVDTLFFAFLSEMIWLVMHVFISHMEVFM
jgi:hypothetical protein